MHKVVQGPQLYGLMAEFSTAEALVAAAEKARDEGYRKMDGFSAYPIEELHEALGQPRTKLPMIVLAGGITGCILGFGMQYFANVIHYPWNIGGRPMNSWPAFIPITFEVTILLSVLSCVFGTLALNGFPQPYHPVWNVPNFERATQDSFFLCIESTDPKFDLDRTRQFLLAMNPVEVCEVAP